MIDFIFFKKSFPTLRTDPSRNGFPRNMIAISVGTKWRITFYHAAFAMKTFHLILTLKSDDHWSGTGKYAVIIAKYYIVPTLRHSSLYTSIQVTRHTRREAGIQCQGW